MARKKDLQDMAAQVGVTTTYDRIVDASTDTVQTLVPLVGGLVAGLIRQTAPRDDQIYLADFANEAAARIVALEADRIDRSYFDSPEWNSDVGRVMDALRLERNRTKRSHYVAALVNGAVTDRPDEVERHRFLDLLDQIRPSHLRLLAAIAGAHHDESGGGIDVWLTSHLPDQDLENMKLDWEDLVRAGLLQGLPSGLANTPTGQRVWHALNAIGKRFVAFVEAQPDALDDS
jgi:hypothetical protein